jgi:hypothetical protein
MNRKTEAEKNLQEYMEFNSAIESAVEGFLLSDGKGVVLSKKKLIEAVVKQLSLQYSIDNTKKIEQRVIRFLNKPSNKFASKRGRKGGIFLVVT